MSEWKTYKLGEICTRIGDGLHGTPKYNEAGEYYFINGSNLVNGNIVVSSNTKKVTNEEYLKYKKDLSDKTILLGINGTIGNIALYNNEKCILGKSAAYLNIGCGFDVYFIKYILQNDHFQHYIMNNASGTTIKNVGLGLLRDYEFSAPKNICTQQEIAKILTSLDDKIELNLQMNQTLETMTQTLFKEWFVDFNFPNFDGELIDGLPKGWVEVAISKLISVKDGTHDSPKQAEDGKFLITSKHLKAHYIDFATAYKISVEDFENINKRSRVEQLDVLISMIGTVGNIYFVHDQIIDFAIKNIGLFKTSERSDLAYFLYFTISSQKVSDYFTKRLAGSTQQYLTLDTLRKMPVIYPDEKTLQSFNSLAKSIFSKIKENTIQIQTLTQTRDILLPKLMSGEIKIS